MSRIAGVAGEGAANMLEPMIEYMCCGTPYASEKGSCTTHTAFAWTGEFGGSAWFGKKIYVVIDGAIYNRDSFASFDTESDAETVAASYIKNGFSKTLENINGDFALALYDAENDSLFVARDRIGLKPLYYSKGDRKLAFASRPGALLKLPWVSSEPNHKFVALFAAGHYRSIDNDPDKSPYKDIAQLPAGSFLKYKNRCVSVSKYWSFKELPDFEDDEESLAERYKELLFDAVKIRFDAAKNPAFTLSGGMDSSSVIAAATETTGEKQHAFSSVYKDATFDETDEISSMLDSAVKEWHPITVDLPDVWQLVEEMVKVNDEPVATATWLSHYLLCKEVKKQNFDSLFGGLGGDELNAGEYEYYFYRFADLRYAGKEDELKCEVDFWQKYHDHPIYKKNFQVMEDGLVKMADMKQQGRCLADPLRLKKYFHTLNRDYFDLSGFEPVMETPFKSYLKNRTFQDITRETAPCCLRAEDRQTAAFGLGNYLPFFDHRLVEFMFRISGDMKIRDGVTKILLRKAMKGVLPDETRNRITKTGWNAPAHIWFAHDQRDKLYDLIKSDSFRNAGIYSSKEVEKLADEHFKIVSSGEPAENHMMFFWQMLNLTTWLKLFTTTTKEN